MDDDIRLGSSQVIDFPDFDFAVILSLHHRIDDSMRRLSERYFRDGYGILVDLLYLGPHLHHASAAALAIFRTVSIAPRRKIRIKLETFTPENRH